MSSRRFVIDTGVAVSALILPRSVPRQALDAARSVGKLLVSPATFHELEAVLRRPKLERYLTEQARLEFLDSYLLTAETVAITETVAACRDPKDDKFLELALSGRAECIISGDSDLLILHPFQEISILSPRDFIAEIIGSGAP
jgi:uncharacterized protein